MFCSQCGAPLLEEAKFCQLCGHPVAELETTSDKKELKKASSKTRKKKSEQKSQKELPTETIGAFYADIFDLSETLAENFCAEAVSTYKTLDNFVRCGENDIEALFFRVNRYFKEFLQKNNVYQYQEDHVNEYTKNFRTEWYDVFQEFVSAWEGITEELQQERDYRAARKAGRGRVVGGGFGLSGAVKGMATAGVMNMGTGMLHSVANGLGNARSEARASSAKASYFNSQSNWNKLRDAIVFDCYSMIEGFTGLWNSLSSDILPFYSWEDIRHAQSIQTAVLEDQVPYAKLEQSLLDMLKIYPVNRDLYIFAGRALPQKKEKFFSMALAYGFDLFSWETECRAVAQKGALALASSTSYCIDYESITYDLRNTLEFMTDAYDYEIGDSFIVFSEEYLSKESGRLRTARQAFATYSNNEIPVCFYMPTNSTREGIFLTDQKLYVRYRNEIETYFLSAEISLDIISDENGSYIEIYKRFQIPISVSNAEEVVPLIRFFVAYCSFLRKNSDFSSGNLLHDVIEHTGLTPLALSERAESCGYGNQNNAGGQAERVKYCSECGAQNDADSLFCSECGSELD